MFFVVMDYKNMSGSSQNNFAILAKIVKHLRVWFVVFLS